MDFYQNLNLRAHGLPHGFQAGHGLLFVLPVNEGPPGAREGIKLEGSEALRHHRFGLFSQLFGVISLAPTIGINPELVPA